MPGEAGEGMMEAADWEATERHLDDVAYAVERHGSAAVKASTAAAIRRTIAEVRRLRAENVRLQVAVRAANGLDQDDFSPPPAP
jgi:hypothetical protein